MAFSRIFSSSPLSTERFMSFTVKGTSARSSVVSLFLSSDHAFGAHASRIAHAETTVPSFGTSTSHHGLAKCGFVNSASFVAVIVWNASLGANEPVRRACKPGRVLVHVQTRLLDEVALIDLCRADFQNSPNECERTTLKATQS